MAVLAMLKLREHSEYLHLHAPAQPIMRTPRAAQFKRGLNRQQLDQNSSTVHWTPASELMAGGFDTRRRRKKRGASTEFRAAAAAAAAAEPSNLSEAMIKCVRAGKTDTWVSEAENKRFQHEVVLSIAIEIRQPLMKCSHCLSEFEHRNCI